MLFGIYLVRKGVVSPAHLIDAVERQMRRRPPIGKIALEAGFLSIAQVSKVLGNQADSQVSFGQIAVEMGYLDKAKLAQLLMMQRDREPRLGELLVEMGVLSPITKNREFLEFRKTLAEVSDPCDVLKA